MRRRGRARSVVHLEAEVPAEAHAAEAHEGCAVLGRHWVAKRVVAGVVPAQVCVCVCVSVQGSKRAHVGGTAERRGLKRERRKCASAAVAPRLLYPIALVCAIICVRCVRGCFPFTRRARTVCVSVCAWAFLIHPKSASLRPSRSTRRCRKRPARSPATPSRHMTSSRIVSQPGTSG